MVQGGVEWEEEKKKLQSFASMKFHRENRFWRCLEKSGIGYTAMTVPICIFTTISNGMQKNAWEYLYLNPDPVIAKLYDGQLAKSNEALQLLRGKPLFLDGKSYPFLMAEIDAAMNEMRTQGMHYRQMVNACMQAILIEILRNRQKDRNIGWKHQQAIICVRFPMRYPMWKITTRKR